MVKIKNAKIDSTYIGFEYGMLTIWLYLSLDGRNQGFGGFCLYNPKYPEEDSVTGKYIAELLRVLQVKSWEKLPGTYCRIQHDDQDNIIRIGNIIKNDWFTQKEILSKGDDLKEE